MANNNKAAQKKYAAARKAGNRPTKKAAPKKTARKKYGTSKSNMAAQKKYAATRKSAPKTSAGKISGAAKIAAWKAKGSPTVGKKGASCKPYIDKAYAKGMRVGARKAAAMAAPAKTAAKQVSALKKDLVEVKAHTRALAGDVKEAKKEAEKAKKEAAVAEKKAEQAKKKADQKMKTPAKKTTKKSTAKKTAAKKAAAQGTLPLAGATKAAPRTAAKRSSKKPKKGSAKYQKWLKSRKTAAGKKRAAARKAKQRAKYAKNARIQQKYADYNQALSIPGSNANEKKALRHAKQKAKYAAAKGGVTPEKLANNAAKLANAETNLEVANEVTQAVNKAEKEVAKETNLTTEMVLHGERPATENEKIELVAKELTTGHTKLGAALRHKGAASAVVHGIVIGQAIGWLDSTQPMARFDNAVIARTGVGYKAFASLGLLIVGGIAEYSFHRARTTKGAMRAEMIANASLRLIAPMTTIESYNLGVTRWSRPVNVVRGLLGLPAKAGTAPVGEVTGLPSRERGQLADRIRDRLADRFQGIEESEIDIDDVSGLASKFGLDEDDQAEIFASVQDFVPFVSPAMFS